MFFSKQLAFINPTGCAINMIACTLVEGTTFKTIRLRSISLLQKCWHIISKYENSFGRKCAFHVHLLAG